jgi:hypothetical protein
MNLFRGIYFAAVGMVLLALPAPGLAQQAAPIPNNTTTLTIPHKSNMTIQSLADRPDADMVQFSNGRKMEIGTLRRLQAIAQKMKAPHTTTHAISLDVLKEKPVASTRTKNLISSGDLALVLKGANSDTFRLPSGRVVNVAQLKVLQPFIERKIGRPLSTLTQRPDLSGKAIPVGKNTSQAQLSALTKLPDNTVLESPQGIRVTLGEARQYLAMRYPAVGGGTRGTGTPQKTPLKTAPQRGGKTR